MLFDSSPTANTLTVAYFRFTRSWLQKQTHATHTLTPCPLKLIRCIQPRSMWCHLFYPFDDPGQKFTKKHPEPNRLNLKACVGRVQVCLLYELSCHLTFVDTTVFAQVKFCLFVCFLSVGTTQYTTHKLCLTFTNMITHQQQTIVSFGMKKKHVRVSHLVDAAVCFPLSSLIRSAERELTVSLGLFTPLVSPCG